MTQQEVDPLGGIAAVPLVGAGAVGATGLAVALSWWHADEIGSPFAALLAVALVAAAAAVAWLSTLPSRAPFTVERLGLVVLLALGGAVAEYVSTVNANRYLYDDFGSLALGLLLLALAPFCSWGALLVAGALGAAVVAILGIGTAGSAATAAPSFSFAVVNAVAVFAPAAAAAAYSATVVSETLAWQRRTNAAALEHEAAMRTGIARSVQQGRVSVLSREVLPFLAQVMTADRISVADADRARGLADALRRALKAGIESTWLDELAATVSSSRGIPVTVHDDEAAASLLRDEQRATITALIAWLTDERRASSVTIAFSGGARSGSRITLAAREGAGPLGRRDIERFTAVARAVGMRGEVSSAGENIRVEFRHDG
ncbi:MULTISPECIES: hypothetical protein [unclassified Agromyces]|uniref:hypothetical protein n=1 Tax=unclassified Agromyces TaxID=2639701 RepID=UPI0030158039